MSVNEIVVNKLIEKMEQGIIPWIKPWNGSSVNRNFETGHAYTGLNVLLTAGRGPYFMTLRQVQERGGRVRYAEMSKSTMLVFWKIIPLDELDANGKKKVIPMMRYYQAWELSQIDGLDEKYVNDRKAKYQGNFDPLEVKPLEAAEKIIDELPEDHATIRYSGGRACYCPADDLISMPDVESFKSNEERYCTLFHELVHSTGHKSRLDRLSEKAAFGSGVYSEEELTAEIGAAFLMAMAGIESTMDNSAAYLAGWLKFVKSDKKTALITAAQRAQKAVDWMIKKQYSEE